VDLDLSDDQRALRDGIAGLLAGRFDSERIRAGFDAAMWRELADAGVVSLLSDGFTMADAAIVFEQLGAACVPGPLVAGVLAHPLGVRDGVVGWVDRPDHAAPAAVEHLDNLDHLLVVGNRGIELLDPATVAGDPSRWPLDPLTPVTTVARLPAGEPIAGADVAHWQRCGAVLTAAFALGIAQHLTDASVAYAKERRQFDRPIGSFQAVKHLLADMAVRVEVARGAVYAAAANLDAPDPGLDVAVATAKLVAGDAAIANGKAATQVHGGMGFTWEVDVHLYLKRAWVLDTHFGTRDEHADAIAATLPAG
jgi:alkylation response protein AidB-like acyl-CoA dehydrogenase